MTKMEDMKDLEDKLRDGFQAGETMDKTEKDESQNLESYLRPVGGFKPGDVRILPPYKSGKSMFIPSLIQQGVLAKPTCIFCDFEGKSKIQMQHTFNCVICGTATPVANMRNNGFCIACFQKLLDREMQSKVDHKVHRKPWRKITDDWEVSYSGE